MPTTVSKFDTAVTDSRFVQAFGVTALVFSVLLYLGIMLGPLGAFATGFFIFGYQPRTFYMALGSIVMLIGILDPSVIPLVLASFVLAKGMEVIMVLNRSSHDDPGWYKTRGRATLGLVTAGIGLAIGLL